MQQSQPCKPCVSSGYETPSFETVNAFGDGFDGQLHDFDGRFMYDQPRWLSKGDLDRAASAPSSLGTVRFAFKAR